MGIFELRHIFGQIPSLVNRQIPSCSRLYFKASVSAKLLTWNDLILIKKKNSFSKERFWTCPRFESERFWNSWPILGLDSTWHLKYCLLKTRGHCLKLTETLTLKYSTTWEQKRERSEDFPYLWQIRSHSRDCGKYLFVGQCECFINKGVAPLKPNPLD